jgi:predicted nucleic acid-binding protein
VILLDTNFLIRALVHGSPEDLAVRRWLKAGDSIGISAIGWAEFLCGPVAPGDLALVARIVGEPLPFGSADAAVTASLFNVAGRRRHSLVDCMIAAVALRAEAPLATSNPADFRRFEPAGLRLAGWPAATRPSDADPGDRGGRRPRG